MSKTNHKNLHAFIWELLLDLEKCQRKAKDCSVMAKIQTLGKLWIYYAIIKKMVVLITQRLCSTSVPLTDGYEWMDFIASSLSAPPPKPHHTSPCEVLTVHTESATSYDFKRVLRTVTVQTRYDPSQHNDEWLMSHVIIYVSWINLLSFHIDMSWSKRTKTLRLLAFQMQNVTVSILSFTLEPGWFISRSMLSDDVSYVPLQHLQ